MLFPNKKKLNNIRNTIPNILKIAFNPPASRVVQTNVFKLITRYDLNGVVVWGLLHEKAY